MHHLVGHWHVDRNRLDEWETIWNQLHEIAAQTSGFCAARLLRSVEHPGKYTAYTIWDEREAWDVYYNNPKVQELLRATFRLLKGPPVQEWFDMVRETGCFR